MILSIMCYLPLSVDLLGLATLQFSNPDPRPRFQTRLTPLHIANFHLCVAVVHCCVFVM